ncbi:HPP family protein [Sulfuriferula plumbiphila]|uniref:HPP family protein n=1 Tax=Sulfuriferula plumbiphila TaxID=171865 RepID=UPI0011BDABE7
MAWSFFGGLVAIETVGYVSAVSATPLVLGSFGASCVLLFGFPESPFSQPRNVISALTGLLFLSVFGAVIPRF